MTRQQGIVVGETPGQKHQGWQQHQQKGQQGGATNNTEVLRSVKLIWNHQEEKQLLAGALRILTAAEAAHHRKRGGAKDECSEGTLAQRSPTSGDLQASRHGSQLEEAAELVADRRRSQRTMSEQKELKRNMHRLGRHPSVHDDARKLLNPPDDDLNVAETAGHAQKQDMDTDIDTDASTASDETTSVFWSSGGGGAFATTPGNSSDDGAQEGVGVISDVAQRPTPETPIPSTRGRHKEPPPPPQSKSPSYETALRRYSGGETISGAAKGKRSRPLSSAVLHESRSTFSGGAKYLEGVASLRAAESAASKGVTQAFLSQHGEMSVAAATTAASAALKGVTRAFSSQHGETWVRPAEAASDSTPIGDDASTVVEGKRSTSGRRRRSRRVYQQQLRPPARSRWSVVDVRAAAEPDINSHVLHPRRTQSTPEAHAVEGGDVRVSEEVGGTQERSPQARHPRAPAPESRPGVLDVGVPSPAQFEQESVFPRQRKAETEADGGGGDSEPGIPPGVPDVGGRSPAQHDQESAFPRQRKAETEADVGGGDGEPGTPPPPVEVAPSVQPSSSSESWVRMYGSLNREQGRHEGQGGNDGPVFSPVAVTPSAGAWSRDGGQSALSATISSWSRVDLVERKSEHLVQEEADASVAAGPGVGVAKRSLEEADDDGFPSPLVWVTRCLDYSSTYGLVFTLSDGSVGLLFTDNSKMVVGPTADTFDYTEAPPSSARAASPQSSSSSPSSPPSLKSGIGTARQARGGDGDPWEACYLSDSTKPTHRYRRDYFPFFLRKKCQVLRYLREHVLLDNSRGGESGREPPAPATASVVHEREAPLMFVEKWQRVGDAACLQLSNKTMQVLFSDNTAILLSNDCRSVEVLDMGRETQPRRKAEPRKGTMKERVRQAKNIVTNFLEGDQASKGADRSQTQRRA
eukprot:g10506.t1